ncbi:protein trunk-like isoform X1 [Varroa destructor]|uniref:Uncharacterized protein n=2 Tax=Varroa TaxID=62624 RepID=A0A7M7JSX8_VARDE|nr:protein trunk-like isoform X1 [Varroa destructor]
MVAAIALLVFVCILQFTLAIPSKSRKCRSANDEELDEMIKRTGITQMINRRYLSVDPPPELESRVSGDSEVQSDQAPFQDFFVDENYEAPVGGNSIHFSAPPVRSKRQMDEHEIEPSSTWTCERTTEWEDLGDNYYPRYLRKVKCLCDRCWFSHYRCVPRSFTVIILRRIEKKCDYGKPTSIEKEWEFVEKAVPVWCECVRN